jgi:hypothetical protein
MMPRLLRLMLLGSVLAATSPSIPLAAQPQGTPRADAVSRDSAASGSDAAASGSDAAARRAAVPFGVGEKLVYDVAVGGARVGQGRLEIVGFEDVRGRETYHSVFAMQGGVLFFKVNDTYESWFDSEKLTSRRFHQRINEGSYKKQRLYEIYPERAIVHQEGKEERPSVPDPLDDGSFLYFIRTVPLEVGRTYTFQRYFIPEKNPVLIKVLRKERVTVPAGSFDAIVIQPVIKTGGLFAEGGEAQIWITDDDRRMIVQLKAKVKLLRTLDLYLKSYQPPARMTTAK